MDVETSPAAPPGKPKIFICIKCKGTSDALSPDALGDRAGAGEQLADAAQAIADIDDVQIIRINCLANCRRGPSVAMRSAGAWTYLFGELDPAADAASLIEGARLLAAAPDGIMPWKGRPTCLKKGLIARIPPLNFAGEPA